MQTARTTEHVWRKADMVLVKKQARGLPSPSLNPGEMMRRPRGFGPRFGPPAGLQHTHSKGLGPAGSVLILGAIRSQRRFLGSWEAYSEGSGTERDGGTEERLRAAEMLTPCPPCESNTGSGKEVDFRLEGNSDWL